MISTKEFWILNATWLVGFGALLGFFVHLMRGVKRTAFGAIEGTEKARADVLVWGDKMQQQRDQLQAHLTAQADSTRALASHIEKFIATIRKADTTMRSMGLDVPTQELIDELEKSQKVFANMAWK